MPHHFPNIGVPYSIESAMLKLFRATSIGIIAGQSGGRIGSENCFSGATFANSL
jgi:hypothetical protein